MADRPISLDPGGPNPDPLPGCKEGDTITWTNNTGKIITGFKLPSCVPSKPNPAPIAVGEPTEKYVVKKGAGGKKYRYWYVFAGTAQTTKNGTIDVGS